MTDTAAATLHLEIRDHIAHLTMVRPEAANTMNLQFGREFLAAAFAIHAAPGVRAVLLTGYASVEANDRAEDENIPVLFKPIDIQQLLQMIADLLRKNDESKEAHGS